jgi:hypothetical protein
MIKVLGDFLGVTYRPAGTFDGKVTPERFHPLRPLPRVKTQSAT